MSAIKLFEVSTYRDGNMWGYRIWDGSELKSAEESGFATDREALRAGNSVVARLERRKSSK